ncbi:MAG TPA: 5-(carboxyamino)imidazole ribonucleotide mutase [Candidatus Eisenbacteria bacterium]|jgi:5-(carboxyamino)imidazole ribonucleotide mutase|nr:5-(carboxyamino)imidazole ribonucleotide mutase [Candidatus Eisenbacteria bacterium]
MSVKPKGSKNGKNDVRVGILMGSESDRAVVDECAGVLRELGVGHEVLVRSAHRTPDAVRDYVRAAEARGIRVLIAAAGGAAHLAGAVASHGILPVIGIPLAATPLAGLDSLLATVQMPAGVPVATVAIGAPGAKNAGYLAAQMLALSDAALADRLRAGRRAMAEKVLGSAASSKETARVR